MSELSVSPPKSEYLVLVDDEDRPVGSLEKLAVHRNGLLHRAFSVLVFNEQGHLLLQRRSQNKYHSGGLWSNTCCGHPRPDEPLEAAARRRLFEEMGFDCDLTRIGSFVYRAQFDNGLTEHELDHVFVGVFDGDVDANPDEVIDWSWMDIGELHHHIAADAGRFTFWFRHIWKLYAPTFEQVRQEGPLNAW